MKRSEEIVIEMFTLLLLLMKTVGYKLVNTINYKLFKDAASPKII